MAWISLLSASRHLGMAMRARTPKTAYLKFQQYKRLLSDKRSKTQSSATGGGAAGGGGLPDQVIGFFGPATEQFVTFTKTHPEYCIAVAGTGCAATGYYLWSKNSKTKKEDKTTAINDLKMVKENAVMVSNKGQEKPEVVTLEGPMQPTAAGAASEQEPNDVPCVSCAVPCGSDEVNTPVPEPCANSSEETPCPTHATNEMVVSSTPCESPAADVFLHVEDQGMTVPLLLSQESPASLLSVETAQNETVVLPTEVAVELSTEGTVKLPTEVEEEEKEKPVESERRTHFSSRRRRFGKSREEAEE